MSKFTYKARQQNGKIEKGSIEALDQRSALTSLRNRGLMVVELKNRRSGIDAKGLFQKKVNSQMLALWANQFNAMYTAGVPISVILTALSEQTDNKVFKKAQLDILDHVRQGYALADAMEKHKKIFPDLMINMVRVGELGGVLDDTLARVSDFYTQDYEITQKVKSALYYPAAVSIMAVVVSWFLIVKVVPTFVSAYASSGAELPLITRIMLQFSEILQHYGLIVLVAIGLLVFILKMWGRTTQGRNLFDKLKLKIPVFGKLMWLNLLARFCRVFATLQKNGIDMITTLTMVERSLNNAVMGKVVQQVREEATRGNSMIGPMKNSKYFPSIVVNMVKVGEDSGTLDQMLEKSADLYSTDVKNMTARLNALLEPLITIILAVIVGVIMLSIITPMFDMMNIVG